MAEPVAPIATIHAPHGMVCSVDHLATGAGVAMLRAGGTAADAAIATNAVLAVTSQHMCGMGGDLFALVHHRNGPPDVLNASGRAGSGADAEVLRAQGMTRIPLRGSVHAVPVPGCVDGWLTLHARHGRLPIADVLAPAIDYADDGFPASPTLAASAPTVQHLDGADDYRIDGLRAGTTLRRPRVAAALRAIAADGRDAWYGDSFGDDLVALGGGLFTPDDLRREHADWVEPLGLRVWDHDVWTAPPNSQGYLTLAAAWIADGLDLPDDPKDPLWAHLLIEASRQAGFDRLDVLHEHADGAGLVAPGRLAPRRALVDTEIAATLGGESYAGGGTTYLCAVDAERTGVSLINSNAAGWGCGLVAPSVGVFLQNRGHGFSLTPGHVAEYGPRRRPPHTLAPALVTTASGDLDSVVGTMGGDAQPQILLQLLARVLRHGESPASAVADGRWALVAGETAFDTWNHRGRVRVNVEGHAPSGWIDGLRRRGHDATLTEAHLHGYGHAQMIRVAGDVLAGAADPRPRTGSAAGH